MRNRLLWLAAALSLASMLAITYCLQSPPRTRVGPDWTPERFHEELVKAGEPWECRPARGGLLLRRPDHVDSWERLAELCEGPPERFAATPGRLYLLRDEGLIGSDESPHEVHFPPLIVRGHPNELRRLVELFTP